MVYDKNNYENSLNITLTEAELKVLHLISEYNNSIEITLSIKFIKYCTGYSISHIKRCIKSLWKDYNYIEVYEQKDVRGRSLANKFAITKQGYLFLSQNETPTIIKEIRKFSQKNSFDIFYLKEHYFDEVLQILQTCNGETLHNSSIAKDFFNKNIQDHKDKLFTKENWIKRAMSYAKIAKQIFLSQTQVAIVAIDEDHLLNDQDIEDLKKQGLSQKEIEEGKKAFKEKNKGNYIQDKTIKRTFTQWRNMLLIWLRNRIKYVRTKILLSVQEYMSKSYRDEKELDNKLGKKLVVNNSLFIKYHNGKRYAKEVWDRLSIGWRENALKYVAMKKEKEMELFLEKKQKEVNTLLLNIDITNDTKLMYQDILQNENERVKVIANMLLTKKCYTKEDKLQKEISEEILRKMYQNQEYDINVLDILNKVDITTPSEEVVAIRPSSYYYNKIKQEDIKTICNKMIEYRISEKYDIRVIMDRDRGEVLWKK